MTYKRTINKFNRGAVDEKFMLRDDVERVVDTCAELKNMLPIRLGPAQYRAGTQWLGYSLAAGTEGSRMIPFLVSGNNSVVLEFLQTLADPSVEMMRVWVDGVPLTRVGTADTITNGEFTSDITGWTDGSDVGGTAAWNAYGGGSVELKGNGVGAYGRVSQALTVTIGTKRTIRIDVGAPQVEILIGTNGVDSTDIVSGIFRRGVHSLTFTPEATPVTITFRNDKAYAVYVNAVVYEAVGEFAMIGTFFPDNTSTAAVLPTLRYTQSADVMYLCTNGHEITGGAWPLMMVERRGNESWSLVYHEFQDGPFGTINTTQLTLETDGTDGDVTLTASLPLFLEDIWDGRSFKLVHGSTEGIVVIIAVIDSMNAYARVTKTLGATTATVDWYPGRFSYYQPGPTALGIFDGRLWLGGNGLVDGSVSDAYLSFDNSIEGDSKAISKTIGFGQVQQIYWMSAGEELLAGTGSCEIKIGSNDFNDTITQSNCKIRAISHIGSAAIEPCRIDDKVYFVQRAGKRIYELTEVTGGVERPAPRDIQLLHPDICGSGIRRFAATRNPEMRLWIVTEDGTAAVCLLDSSENVNGWSTIETVDCELLDLAVIPDNEEDEVYFRTQRDAEESNCNIERVAQSTDAIGGTISRHYDGHILLPTPGTTSELFWHLHEKEVYVWANGKEHGPYTVDVDGVVTFPANTWTNGVVGVRHHGHWLSNRLAHYIPASVVNDRKRVTGLGVVLRNAVLKTITYGDGIYCDYPLPVATGVPSSDPNLVATYSGPVGEPFTDGENLYTVYSDSGYVGYAWGRNGNGQLGLNDVAAHTTPVGFGPGWEVMALGALHSLLETSTGGAKVSGNNSFGELGIGSTTGQSSPVSLSGSWLWLAANHEQGISCGVKDDGTIWRWGDELQLWAGFSGPAVSSPVQVGTKSNWTQFVLSQYRGAGIKTDGTLWLSGDQSAGDLTPLGGQTAAEDPSDLFRKVGVATNWSQVWCSEVCTVALKSNGELWVWGAGAGSFGGSTSSPVMRGSDWAKASFGDEHILGIKTNGTLWAWGLNTSGQLGRNGAVGSTNSPVQITTNSNWTQVAAGKEHSLALRDTGRVYSFGDNLYGQLGLGGSTDRSSPNAVGGSNYVAIAAGGYHSMGFKNE